MPWDIDPITAARAFWCVDLYGCVACHESGLTVVFQPYCDEPLPPLSLKADVQGGYTWLCQATRLPEGTPEDEVWELLFTPAPGGLRLSAGAGNRRLAALT